MANRKDSRLNTGGLPARYSALLILAVAWSAPAMAAKPHRELDKPAANRLFTLKVLPLLKEKCFGCHGVDPKDIRGDYNVAWPSAELAVMGADGAVEIIHRRRIAHARNPEQERERLTEDFKETFANPYKAAAMGYLDDVIEPNQTRQRLCRALDMLVDKEELRPARKHGNIPL